MIHPSLSTDEYYLYRTTPSYKQFEPILWFSCHSWTSVWISHFPRNNETDLANHWLMIFYFWFNIFINIKIVFLLPCFIKLCNLHCADIHICMCFSNNGNLPISSSYKSSIPHNYHVLSVSVSSHSTQWHTCMMLSNILSHLYINVLKGASAVTVNTNVCILITNLITCEFTKA